MKKMMMPAIAVLITAGGVVLPVTGSDAAMTSAAASFSNCTELNHVYQHGISNRHLTRHGWIRRGASGKGAYKPTLYQRVHSNLDRDDDHIACES
jgi:hypothetical protein